MIKWLSPDIREKVPSGRRTRIVQVPIGSPTRKSNFAIEKEVAAAWYNGNKAEMEEANVNFNGLRVWVW
jgi:hypothetical protein